jgi:hypothetical protein
MGVVSPVYVPKSGYSGCRSWFTRLINYPYCKALELTTEQTRPLVYGDSFPLPPMPPTMRSTLPGGEEIPAVPASGEEAQQTVDAIIAQQGRDWQSQTSAFFEDVKRNAEGANWWLLGGIAVAVLGLAVGMSDGPRRYGR